MANSIQLKLKGKGYWARVFPENKDVTGYDDMLKDIGGQYTVDVDLDTDSLKALSDAKSQSPSYPKDGEDIDGNPITVYRFKRQHEKYDSSGKLLEWASGQPKVTDADDNDWTVEEKGLIGNGSDLELTVTVYKAGRLYGTRLESVKVVELVDPPVMEPS